MERESRTVGWVVTGRTAPLAGVGQDHPATRHEEGTHVMFDGIRNTLIATWLVTAIGMAATAFASQTVVAAVPASLADTATDVQVVALAD